MIDIYNFAELSNNERQIIAGIVSASSRPNIGHDHSLAQVETDEILASNLALVGFAQDSFAGYIRGKKTHTNTETSRIFRQVGSLVVMPEFRKNGVGNRLVTDLTALVVSDEQIPYAFCGPNSKPTFMKAGYREALPGELPQDAISLLGNQEMVWPVDLS